MTRLFWLLLLGGVAACDASRPSESRCLELPPSEGAVVARVGLVPLSTSQLLRRVREQGTAAVRYTDEKRLKAFVEDQIRFELLVQAAKERGLDKDPDVVETARKVMVRKLLAQDLGPQMFQGQANDQAIQKYYESHLEDYQQPERRRVAHIELEPTPDGQAKAQSLIDKLAASADVKSAMRVLAMQQSLDKQTRVHGGELNGFVSQAELEKELGPSFASEAFKLGAGELGRHPVQSTRGWHVVMVIAQREAMARPLDDVRSDIADKLLESDRALSFEKYVREIRQRYPVALYEDELPKLAQTLQAPEGKAP